MPLPEIWLVAHRDRADEVFSGPVRARLDAIRGRLSSMGYVLKLDVGKRSTRATVSREGLRARSTYGSLEGFMAFEEARLAEMEAAIA